MEGFVSAGQPRDAVPGFAAEVYAVYVHPSMQGRGIGVVGDRLPDPEDQSLRRHRTSTAILMGATVSTLTSAWLPPGACKARGCEGNLACTQRPTRTPLSRNSINNRANQDTSGNSFESVPGGVRTGSSLPRIVCPRPALPGALRAWWTPAVLIPFLMTVLS